MWRKELEEKENGRTLFDRRKNDERKQQQQNKKSQEASSALASLSPPLTSISLSHQWQAAHNSTGVQYHKVVKYQSELLVIDIHVNMAVHSDLTWS